MRRRRRAAQAHTAALRPVSTAAPQPTRADGLIEWAVAYADGALATYGGGPDGERQARVALAYAHGVVADRRIDPRIRRMYAGAQLVTRVVSAWTHEPPP